MTRVVASQGALSLIIKHLDEAEVIDSALAGVRVSDRELVDSLGPVQESILPEIAHCAPGSR